MTGCDFDVYKLPAAGRHRHRGQPDHGDRRVRRRARPGAEVDGEGQRRQRRPGDRHRPRGLHARSSRSSCATDTDLPDNAVAELRQTSLLGREVRVPERPRGRQRPGPARERRHHPARPHRPQPRGRGGARRAQPAAQRRRRGPAQDHRQRAQPRARGPRGLGPVGAAPDRGADGPARREQGRHRRRDRVAEPARDLGQGPDGRHRLRARGAPERADLARPAARRPGQDAEGAQPARRRRRPGDQGVEGVDHRVVPPARRRC